MNSWHNAMHQKVLNDVSDKESDKTAHKSKVSKIIQGTLNNVEYLYSTCIHSFSQSKSLLIFY